MLTEQALILSDPGRGGANEKVSAQNINDNQSAPPDRSTFPLKNVHTNEIGSIVARSGYSVHSTGAVTIDGSPDIVLNNICGLYQYKKNSGNRFNIVVADDGALNTKIVDLSTPASPSDITGSISFTAGTFANFATVADKLIITTEDRDAPIQWNGTGDCSLLRQTIEGSPDTYVDAPAGKYCIEFFNYLFIANTNANPERVYWSAQFDPEAFTIGSDFKRVNGEITGLGKRDNVLFIFTKTSITTCQYNGDATTPFSFDTLETNIGCYSHRSIVTIEGVLHWMGADGHIYRMSAYKPERVTEAIPLTMARMNSDAFAISCAVDHREIRQYWCAVTYQSSTINDFVIVLDYLNNELFMYDGMNINCLANWVSSGGATQTYFGDNTGRVYLTNSGDSDYPAGVQTEIDWWRYTKQFHFGNPGTVKFLSYINATANNGGNYTTLIDVIGDFGATGGDSLAVSHNGGGDLLGSTWVLGTSKLGRISDVQTYKDISINLCYVQFKFHNKAYSQPAIIRDFELYYKNLGVGRSNV